MTAPGWLMSSVDDVPPGDAWLGPRERTVLAGLRVDRRRADWRLGRWTAKAAVAEWLGVAADHIEILAAAGGAPEVWLDGAPAPVSVSLSHRAGRALAVVIAAPTVVGCDLELLEPRSDAFVREWMNEAEQRTLAPLAGAARDRRANLLWTAKEAAAKVRRQGLRLDVRHAAVELGSAGEDWSPLSVRWRDGLRIPGWWRDAGGWVMAIAGAPALARPRRLAAGDERASWS